MSENILFLLIGMNIVLMVGLVALFFKKSTKQKIEVQYFEHIEDIDGPLSESKKVVIKGQLFLDGLPVGGQYVVAEKSFKKFDYDKLKTFKNEVIEPIAKVGYYVAMAKKKGLMKAISFFKKAS